MLLVYRFSSQFMYFNQINLTVRQFYASNAKMLNV